LNFGALTIARGGLAMNGVASLASLDGFARLRELQGALSLQNNVDLKTLSGLQMLEKVGAVLYFYRNASLVSAALPALASVGAQVQFEDNAKLETVALSALTSVGRYSNADSFYFRSLPELKAVDVGAIGETPGGLEFTTLSATADSPLALNFGALTIARGGLAFTAVSNSSALERFTLLRQVGGALSIRNCANLTSLTGLDALANLMGNLTVSGNPQLPTCRALSFRDRVRPIDSGASSITGNLADNCSNG
ncbi:MAG: hypothetical protein RL701_1595, partial [Pseudomonadota bacterium]